ncbi:XdhC/CoxI family protein (plasmid) [Deinococcus psychrotolerans]|uniref:XdhC/CoxI family protein n=1 Tax=Deinococcus psychrotolerans TaxID=2489213 RepID=A0A3G8YHZ3_9DEIO|nr:XdhC/CoxI family protein [Deinococcus psychrotolerans]AZI44872.1 XdhC/CoxI family protein [Deinococcus psychrotolerans]
MERLDVLNGLREARFLGERAALATVVNVIGSAYRREGTVMLVRADGTYTCLVSGGCLEGEIVFLAQEVMRSGEARLQRYNLDEERMFGLGIGCAGEMDIYIEAANPADPLQQRWHQTWENFELAAQLTCLSGSGARTILTPLEVYGSLGAVQEQAEVLMRQRLASPQPKAGLVELGGLTYFLDVNIPPPELLLFGAAHDSQAVVRLACESGFRVRVVDMRAGLLTPERFPGASLSPLTPEQFSQLSIGPRSFVVVMNHHFLLDLASLRRALQSEAPFIGLLGPRSRLDKLAANAQDEGLPLTPAELSRIRNPLGLAIGADTTTEVAISVVAELLAASRGFSGGPLDGHQGKIHSPALASEA